MRTPRIVAEEFFVARPNFSKVKCATGNGRSVLTPGAAGYPCYAAVGTTGGLESPPEIWNRAHRPLQSQKRPCMNWLLLSVN